MIDDKSKIPFEPDRLPLSDLDWGQLAEHISRANRSIATFGASLNQIPNPQLLLSPLSLSEALASSSIENIHSTLEEVLGHEIKPSQSEEGRNDVREVLNCQQALAEAIESLDDLPLDSQLVRQIHATLLSGPRGANKDPGRFRTGAVYIGQIRGGFRRVVYTPPKAEDVPKLFGDLERYIDHNEKDPLVQAAIVHAQFEIIHPFWDGNGRTGRILIPLFLYYRKAINTPMFYLSEYFEAHRSDYYLYLQKISKSGDWLSWIKFFLTAIDEQAKASYNKVNAILSLYKSLEAKITDVPAPKHYIKVLDFIFSTPIFSTKMMVDQLAIPRATCSVILRHLSESGVIRSYGQGRSSRYSFDELRRIINR